ncbi:squamous cell carcinoma antigen recognized by T-cells 3 [Anthonomus grandis grandis]|uniref:squamous cell carcinoma antigen recognized by T-cells 3 n=1 Tax=Anthonomus grandis grandis TaxID=2921223 RepID=UPI002166769B|nr:squamous cell carcinoma antigen recognized by T-cells 3 [Anthonomus grandis grandis]
MSEKSLEMDTKADNKSDDSDSSESSDGEDGEEQTLLDRARQLEKDLADSKYLYDSHVELVGLYKKLGDLISLREAYQRFHEYFPLTPTLWMDWINVEKSVASTHGQKEFVFGLFDKAVEDYLSVELWSEYAQYAIGASSLERTRTILERAVNSAGLVCNSGALIWATYREIENLHISMHEEGSEPWKMQILRLADIFKRELSIPLLEMENTYGEWQAWMKSLPEGLVDPKPVEYGYGKAIKTLEAYKPFEEELLGAKSNEEFLVIYKNYIKTVSDPSTIICLYERAVAQHCLVPDIWLEYCSYAFKLTDQALLVCKKSLRNCPWSEDLWVFKIRVLENLQKKESTVMECFEEGISSIAPSPGLELWLTYLEYNHRCVGSPEKLDRLFNQAIQQLGFENDPQAKIGRLFSRILAHRGNMKEARKVWNQIIVKSANKGSYCLWLEYINIEKQYGEANTLRSLFQKALNSVEDWPQGIIDEWLMYERHFGTLEDVMKCVTKCRELNIPLNYQETSQEQSNSNASPLGKGKKRKMEPQVNRRGDAVKTAEPPVKKTKAPVEKNPETTVFISNLHPNVDEERLKEMFPNAANLEVVMDKKGKSRCFGYAQFKTPEEAMVALSRDREPLDGRPVFISEIKTEKTEKKPTFKYATREEKNKLFVRGLPIKKTKQEIEEIFKKYGAKDVRLVLHKSGQPKGLAYIEFESESHAQNALKQTDQMTIDDHVITVAISAPPPKKDKTHKSFEKNDEDPIRHARSRLQTSLLPRSLQVTSLVPSQVKKNGSEQGGKMKSNSDFRAMLLKK